MDTLTVKSSQVKNIALRAMLANRPLFIWGPPGIGKSELVESITYSGSLGNAAMLDLRLALMEPTDLRGYPFRNPETNQMEWAPPADLPTAEFAAQYDTVVLFLDELNSAPPSVQAAAYQLVLNRRIGQYVLPKNVRIIAAGNRETDRGVTFRMPAPLANRLLLHVHGTTLAKSLLLRALTMQKVLSRRRRLLVQLVRAWQANSLNIAALLVTCLSQKTFSLVRSRSWTIS